MEKNISLSLPKACSEKWENFTPAQQGGFCTSCSKVVVDFTTMTDAQVLQYFNNRPTATCGRFRSGQLKIYSEKVPLPVVNPGFMLLKAGMVSLLLMLVSRPSHAQESGVNNTTQVVQHPDDSRHDKSAKKKSEKIVRGVVRSGDDQSLIPGVNVYLKNTDIVTYTDVDGRFEFPRKLKAGDVLSFSFIGYETKEYAIGNDVNTTIEIPMMQLVPAFLGEVVVNEVYEEQPRGFAKWWNHIRTIF